jgi:hypothetical protein
MSEADPNPPKSPEHDRAAYVAWLNAELQKGLDSGISERSPRQIFDDFWKKYHASKD